MLIAFPVPPEWMHVAGHAVIAAAAIAVPVLFIRARRYVPPILWVLGAFVVSCGLAEIADLFTPEHEIVAIARLVTAGAAAATLLLLPRALLRELQRRERARLASIVDSCNDGIITMDRSGVVTGWNRSAERIYGWSAAEMLGWPASALVPPGAGDFPGIAGRAGGAERVENVETTHMRRDGRRIGVALTVSPIRDERDAVVGFSAIVRDITERIREREERERLAAGLAEAQHLQGIGRLAAGVAHEINGPLQYIGDNTCFLRDAFEEMRRSCPECGQPDLAHEVPQAIEQTLEGVEQVSQIVRALREFAHPGLPEKRAVCLNHLVQNAVAVSRNEWKYVADLVADLDAELPPVPCHDVEISEVLLNLIVNAAHAIEASGRKGTITVRTRHEGDWAEIRVSDDGTGIPEEIQSRIFEPAFTTKEVGKGTGQGLAIARAAVVGRHGGTLTFETEVGRGTTFVVRLPLVTD